MGVIKRKYFGVTSDMVKALLSRWEGDREGADQLRNRSISCVEAMVVIGFCVGIRGE